MQKLSPYPRMFGQDLSCRWTGEATTSNTLVGALFGQLCRFLEVCGGVGVQSFRLLG